MEKLSGGRGDRCRSFRQCKQCPICHRARWAPRRSAKLANNALRLYRSVFSSGGVPAAVVETALFLIFVFFSAASLDSAASLANRSALNFAVFSLTARASASY